jgi:hypothetical protein
MRMHKREIDRHTMGNWKTDHFRNSMKASSEPERLCTLGLVLEEWVHAIGSNTSI